jgi:hypothetical protein
MGSLMIILCIVFIGFGSRSGVGKAENMSNLILAIGSALISGMTFSLNSINLNYIVKTLKFPAN